MADFESFPFPHCPAEPQNEAEWMQALADLARHLRGPGGCPWDQEQSARDFAAYAREEGDEYVEALESGDAAHAREEWGDVFFVLLASAAAAETQGLFKLEEALALAHAKMIRRHEHVFGEEPAASPTEAIERWQQIKQREKSGDQK
jgi:uncharacterized protein YabN with tetrapyrrole methylase and pyrophosphatase domain